MQPEYEKMKELLKNKDANKVELIANTETKKQQIIELNAEYNAALTQDNDQQADKIQDEIYNLKKVIKRNTDKVDILVNGADKELDEQASKVLEESNKAIDQLNENTKKEVKRYEELRMQLIDIAVQIQDDKSKVSPYRQAVGYLMRELPKWAEEQVIKQPTSMSWMNIKGRPSISSYRKRASNPTLKPLEYYDIKQAQAKIG